MLWKAVGDLDTDDCNSRDMADAYSADHRSHSSRPAHITASTTLRRIAKTNTVNKGIPVILEFH